MALHEPTRETEVGAAEREQVVVGEAGKVVRQQLIGPPRRERVELPDDLFPVEGEGDCPPQRRVVAEERALGVDGEVPEVVALRVEELLLPDPVATDGVLRDRGIRIQPRVDDVDPARLRIAVERRDGGLDLEDDRAEPRRVRPAVEPVRAQDGSARTVEARHVVRARADREIDAGGIDRRPLRNRTRERKREPGEDVGVGLPEADAQQPRPVSGRGSDVPRVQVAKRRLHRRVTNTTQRARVVRRGHGRAVAEAHAPTNRERVRAAVGRHAWIAHSAGRNRSGNMAATPGRSLHQRRARRQQELPHPSPERECRVERVDHVRSRADRQHGLRRCHGARRHRRDHRGDPEAAEDKQPTAHAREQA